MNNYKTGDLVDTIESFAVTDADDTPQYEVFKGTVLQILAIHSKGYLLVEQYLNPEYGDFSIHESEIVPSIMTCF